MDPDGPRGHDAPVTLCHSRIHALERGGTMLRSLLVGGLSWGGRYNGHMMKSPRMTESLPHRAVVAAPLRWA